MRRMQKSSLAGACSHEQRRPWHRAGLLRMRSDQHTRSDGAHGRCIYDAAMVAQARPMRSPIRFLRFPSASGGGLRLLPAWPWLLSEHSAGGRTAHDVQAMFESESLARRVYVRGRRLHGLEPPSSSRQVVPWRVERRSEHMHLCRIRPWKGENCNARQRPCARAPARIVFLFARPPSSRTHASSSLTRRRPFLQRVARGLQRAGPAGAAALATCA